MAASTSSDAAVHGAHDPDVSRNKTYVGVAVILALFTAMEVAAPPLLEDGPRAPLLAILFGLMIIKFGMVTAYFMHLKFDKKFLTVAFYSGLVLAVAVYIAVLAAFRFFGEGGMVH